MKSKPRGATKKAAKHKADRGGGRSKLSGQTSESDSEVENLFALSGMNESEDNVKIASLIRRWKAKEIDKAEFEHLMKIELDAAEEENKRVDAEINRLEREIERLKAENEKRKHDAEIDELIDTWIEGVEGGEDREFPVAMQRVKDDGTEEIDSSYGERMMEAAKKDLLPVNLWETGLLIFGSKRCAYKLTELLDRILLILSLPFEIQTQEDAHAGARWIPGHAVLAEWLGRFYGGVAREVNEVTKKLPKDQNGRRTYDIVSAKHRLLRLLQRSSLMRASYESEVNRHHRDGWAGDAADMILKRVQGWKLWCHPLPFMPSPGVKGWPECEIDWILTPKAYAWFQVASPWHLVWSKRGPNDEESTCEAANALFPAEWRKLWTPDRVALLRKYEPPTTNKAFELAWTTLYAPLQRTIPLPAQSNMRGDSPRKRAGSVKNALRVRLGIPR